MHKLLKISMPLNQPDKEGPLWLLKFDTETRPLHLVSVNLQKAAQFVLKQINFATNILNRRKLY